jgi:hypothetical protein
MTMTDVEQQPIPQGPPQGDEQPIGGFRPQRQRQQRKTINSVKPETLSIEDALKNVSSLLPYIFFFFVEIYQFL